MKNFSILCISFLLLAGSINLQAQEGAKQVISYNNNRIIYQNSFGPLQNFKVEVRGEIEVAEDDRDIIGMSSDGYLEIEKTVFGNKRKIIITSQGNSLKKEYYEGRSKQPYEPEGRKWLAEILPDLVKTSTIGAESRTNRFYKKGGTNLVLQEIDKLESDYVKHHYASLLLKLPVQSKEYPTVIQSLSKSISSDY